MVPDRDRESDIGDVIFICVAFDERFIGMVIKRTVIGIVCFVVSLLSEIEYDG